MSFCLSNSPRAVTAQTESLTLSTRSALSSAGNTSQCQIVECTPCREHLAFVLLQDHTVPQRWRVAYQSVSGVRELKPIVCKIRAGQQIQLLAMGISLMFSKICDDNLLKMPALKVHLTSSPAHKSLL